MRRRCRAARRRRSRPCARGIMSSLWILAPAARELKSGRKWERRSDHGTRIAERVSRCRAIPGVRHYSRLRCRSERPDGRASASRNRQEEWSWPRPRRDVSPLQGVRCTHCTPAEVTALESPKNRGPGQRPRRRPGASVSGLDVERKPGHTPTAPSPTTSPAKPGRPRAMSISSPVAVTMSAGRDRRGTVPGGVAGPMRTGGDGAGGGDMGSDAMLCSAQPCACRWRPVRHSWWRHRRSRSGAAPRR